MIVAIDTEYIAESAAQGKMPSPRPDVRRVYCEAVQMGACKIDDEGNEIGMLNITIAPNRIATLPKWFVSMTGITEKQRRDSGVGFPEALQQLAEFAFDATETWTFNGDWWVVKGNAKAHGVALPFEKPFQRVKPRLKEWGVELGDYKRLGFTEMNSGNLYKVLGIELPEIIGVGAHDAAHDARSLAHSIQHLTKR